MTKQPYIDEKGVFQTLEIWDHEVDPRIKESDDRVKLNSVKRELETSTLSFEQLFDRYSGSCMNALTDIQRANQQEHVIQFVERVDHASQHLDHARRLASAVGKSADEFVICEFLHSLMWFRFEVGSLMGHADFDLDDEVYERDLRPDIHTARAREIESSANTLVVFLLTEAKISVEIYLTYRECWWAFKQRNVVHKSDIEYELELYQRGWFDEEFGGVRDE